MIVAFTLTVPNVGSWNGVYAGDRPNKIVCRKLSNKIGSEIAGKDFFYDFGDGWGVNVSAKEVDYKEKNKLMKKSTGFGLYSWMVNSIIERGKIDKSYPNN